MDTDVVSFTRTFSDVTVVRQTPKEYVASVVLDELLQATIRKTFSSRKKHWQWNVFCEITTQTIVSVGKIATWLILPVVIRSSQRLSHACLSINLLL